MDSDYAIVELASVATPLPLDASGLVARLGMTRVIEDTDRVTIGVVACYDGLNSVAHQRVVPLRPAEELLQGTSRRASEIGDGLYTLPRQIGQLTTDIAGPVAARLGTCKAISELIQKIGELWA